MLPWCIMKMGSRGEPADGMYLPMKLWMLLCGVFSSVPWMPPPFTTQLMSRLFWLGFLLVPKAWKSVSA
jgi:hypothetical protein